ncbi:MAG: hypothetical protein C4547_09550 [Phycisphaerales bacterium]|nr:MAG: hypothetical protein C4547_09550 [Phycisphaerales bacterium]
MSDDYRSSTPESSALFTEVQQQFALLEARFRQLKAEVRQAMQLSALGTATAVWAHELNNLITPQISYAQVALRQDTDVELMRKALRVALANGEAIKAMSERILGLSAQPAGAAPQHVGLRAATEEALECLGRDPSRDGIDVVFHIPDDLSVWADPHSLKQILFNLLLNAREAMASKHGGRLTVRARRQGDDRAMIDVSDTGGGIAPDRIPHIFEPFATSKVTKANGKVRFGGVGLSLSKQLVEECGGTIQVSSRVGEGTTFSIALPLGEPAVKAAV